MKFEQRGDAEYLIRRPYSSSTRKSFGRRSPETEAKLEAFLAGKSRVEGQIRSLRGQLEDQFAVLRARGLDRVPQLTARVIRKLDDLGWLGTFLIVLGTNALFAYEAKAAVRIESGPLATGDVDVLLDARRRLVMSGGATERRLVGALQSVDRSFRRSCGRACTIANKDGYVVALIKSQGLGRIMREVQARLSDDLDEPAATTTDSSRWLLNAPKFEAMAFDERGLPLRIVTLDPRVFALQKQRIVENDPTRDPAERVRDEQQANLVARIVTRHLGLKFDDSVLSGLPRAFRDLAAKLTGSGSETPAEW